MDLNHNQAITKDGTSRIKTIPKSEKVPTQAQVITNFYKHAPNTKDVKDSAFNSQTTT